MLEYYDDGVRILTLEYNDDRGVRVLQLELGLKLEYTAECVSG